MSELSPKQRLRSHLLRQRKALSVQQRAQAQSALLQQVTASALWQRSQHIGCYLAMPEELDTAALLQQASKQGKRIYVPVVTGSGNMIFVAYQVGDACAWQRIGGSAFSMPLRQGQDASNQLDCLIVPAVGVDKQQHRLGYGKGFYDRFLSDHPQLLDKTIACVFRQCYVDTVFPEVHDCRMHTVVIADHDG